MNREEQITLEYLKSRHGGNVVPVPKHEDPPDILVNSSIAVEVRRLNQYFFEGEEPEDLESLSVSFERAFKEVLKSFDNLYDGVSYWVTVYYQRSLNSGFSKIKKEMKLALHKFLDLEAPEFPYEISVNPEITFLLYKSNVGNGKLFPITGSSNFDVGGGNIRVYTDNIRHCISEKSSKISGRLGNYSEWWLYLVDYLGFGLNQPELLEVIREVGNTGSFNKVVILDYHGQNAFLTIQGERA